MSQQALIIDVAAKVLADNIASLMCAAASKHADLPARSRKCNRSYAATLMQRLLPRLVLFIGDVRAAISDGHRLARRHLAALRPGSISASSRSSPQTPAFLRVQGVRLEFGGLRRWPRSSGLPWAQF